MAAIQAAATKRAGMGEDLFAPKQNILQQAAQHEVVKTVRETVSPWLWLLSIVSFGMALINRKQIATMFGNWRRKHRIPKTA